MSLGESAIKVAILGDDSSALRAFKRTQSAAKETGRSFDDTKKHFGGMSAGMTAAASGIAAGGAVVVAALADSAKQALEYDDKLTKLKVTMKDAGLSYDANAGAINRVVDANIKLGTKEQDTLQLLSQGITSTGSLTESTHLLATAQNIAAESGKPLADVFTAVIKASEGQLRPLKMLGIDLPVVAGGALKTKTAYIALGKAEQNLKDVEQKVHEGLLKGPAALAAVQKATVNVTNARQKFADVASSGTEIVSALDKKFAGQSAAQSKTTIGQYKAEMAQVDQWKREVGQKVVAFIANDVIPELSKMASGWHNVSKSLNNFGGAVYDDVIGPIDHAYHHVGDLLDSLATLGVGTVVDDTQKIYASNDKKMGWKPGTTANMIANGASVANGQMNHRRGSTDPNFVGPIPNGRASGGPVMAGETYTVGEHGPEQLTMGRQSGYITPNGAGRGGGTIIINMPAGIDPGAVTRELRRHNRRNGIT